MRVLPMMVMSAAALIVAGCGLPGNGTVQSCQGGYSGPYSGQEEGLVSSTLRPRGLFVATFVSPTNALYAVTATVTESGALASAGGRQTITGTFDLQECTVSGNWSRDALSGTFTMTKQ